MIDLADPINRLAARKDFDSRFPDAPRTITAMKELAKGLLAEAAKFDLLRQMFGINEDILGLYSFRRFNDNSLVDEEWTLNARADLYWGVIGLVARVLGVGVEALTVKVLAHELAHAYTHIGADADGKRWDSDQFARSERGLKEGLAQYYTVRVLDRLEREIPEARRAYEKLLPHQPAIYCTHLAWLSDFTPEEVRDAMLTIRRGGSGTVEEFNEALLAARRRLRRQ